MKVFDLMSDSIITVGASEPVTAAARLMQKYNIGAVPVCDDKGHLRGMITDRDIVIRCIALGKSAKDTVISETMTRGAITIDDRAHISEAARLMADAQVRRLPVCRDGLLVGMISLADLARNSDCDTEAAEALCEISKNIRRT
ncbi:MAG: CBS domain-containing protein [Bacillota bacterium]|nr:CBS domain-containing protein [Bacillota bacterium]